MIDLPDPKSSLNKMDLLVFGFDAYRHPFSVAYWRR
jgi:hypothetical protein